MSSPSRKLLAWYDANARRLPWRVPPGPPPGAPLLGPLGAKGARPDPYRVWLSEIMLQQTTVATVIGYFGDFMARWPDVRALAAADLDEVLHAWQGLGYYARARNLHKCARVVADDLDGRFPDTEEGLAALPGIGPYTAAAVAAIAFARKATPVDGNIERVVARLYALDAPLPGAKAEIRELARALTPARRAGDFAQALMDLGAGVCRPKAPDCRHCPLAKDCRGHLAGDPETYPRRKPKAPRPTRHSVVYWLTRPDGAVMVRRRPENGLLGGMMEFPSTPWAAAAPDAPDIAEHAPMDADWRAVAGEVVHVFTHFRLVLRVVRARAPGRARGDNAMWCAPADFSRLALPTVMKKVARLVAAAEDQES